jgi:hypothetical protein
LGSGVFCRFKPGFEFASEADYQLSEQAQHPNWKRQYYATFSADLNNTGYQQYGRFYDLYAPAAGTGKLGTAYELKVGYQAASQRNRSQIYFDTVVLQGQWPVYHSEQY